VASLLCSAHRNAQKHKPARDIAGLAAERPTSYSHWGRGYALDGCLLPAEGWPQGLSRRSSRNRPTSTRV
jgi:hypothetical protein